MQPPHSHENLSCTFCGKRSLDVEQLIASATPGVFICDGCVSAAELAAGGGGAQSGSTSTTDRECSFCLRPIAIYGSAPGRIRAECVDICRELVAEAGRE